MRLLSVTACEPRNIHCHRPVICATVDLGQLAHKTTADINGIAERVENAFPGIKQHHCSIGRPGGFCQRLREGTGFGHLAEHLALELQVCAGIEVRYGKTRSTDRSGVFTIVVECIVPDPAMIALTHALDSVQKLIASATVPMQQYIKEVKRAHAQHGLGPSTRAIMDAAKRRSIPVIKLGGDSLLQLGYGRNQRRIWATITDHTGCLGADIAGDKILAKTICEQAGLPVPRGGVAKTESDLQDIIVDIGLPVVIKPFNGNQGKGVALNLNSKRDIIRAYKLALKYSDSVICEQYISGRHYRICVVGSSVVAAAERIPARIVGDGKHTIKQLVEKINSDPLRGDGHELPLTKIKIDAAVLMVLARQNKTADSIPGPGEVCYLRDNSNLSTGGTAIDVTDQLHPTTAKLAVRAAQQVGLDIAGVDLVTPDISAPLNPDGAIIEVNAAPGLRMHLYPSRGRTRPVHNRIIDHLFLPGADCRIPLVAVTGTNGKTTTVRLINSILRQRYSTVGMTCTDGVWINDLKIASKDMAGVCGAHMVLTDKTVDAAVLEVARGGLIRQGLGYDKASIGIITNVQTDHIGQDGVESVTDLVQIKSLIAEAVEPEGAVVLNADDPAAPLIAERASAPIIYTSASSNNPIVDSHIEQGGKAVVVNKGQVEYVDKKHRKPLLTLADIPVTHQGKCEAGTANALASIAAALGSGCSLPDIKHGLLAIKSGLNGNAGRLNLVTAGDRRILIDYGHNPPAFAAAAGLARNYMNGGVMIGVIGVPGDRSDEQIITSGQVAGRLFDQLVLKEDSDLRGRSPGEVAKLLATGAQSSGVTTSQILTELDERKAVKKALSKATERDMVVVFYESLPRITKAIEAACGQLCESRVLQ